MPEVFHVYVLYSRGFNKIYIGYTGNLEQRLLSHNELAVKGWTIRYRPWELLFYERYASKSEAMHREKQLKSYQGRLHIWMEVRKKFGQSV
ncbi:MAG: GIY-YIG nuclease family protein [Bacteroidales bacterium]|nr:GIY-YIG nuclease family protein [Bacteroidales bacterium]